MQNRYGLLFILQCCVIATLTHADPWDSDNELREMIERVEAIPHDELSQLDTSVLLEVYMYRFAAHFPMSASADAALLALERRTDLQVDDVVSLLSEVKLIERSESTRRWATSSLAIAGLQGVSGTLGLLDPAQEPRAHEAMMAFVVRAVEYTVRNDGAYNWLLSMTAHDLAAHGWLDYGESLEPYDGNRVIDLFLNHFGLMASKCSPERNCPQGTR